MGPYDAVLKSCEAVFDAQEYQSLLEHLDGLAQVYLGPELVEKEIDEIASMCEILRELICLTQPKELARRQPLDIVDLAEVWAVDLWAWVPPAGKPSDYWVTVAAKSIVEKASCARTRVGRTVGLDQATFVVRKVQTKHRQANDISGLVSCAALIDRIQSAEVR